MKIIFLLILIATYSMQTAAQIASGGTVTLEQSVTANGGERARTGTLLSWAQ